MFLGGGVCRNGRFVYTTRHNPLKYGHTKTEAYLDGRRCLDARFCVGRFQEAVCVENSAALTAQLQSLIAFLDVIGYRNGISELRIPRGGYSKPKPLDSGIFEFHLLRWENPETRWTLLKPLYGLTTSREECYGDMGYFSVGELGGVAFLDKSVFF